MAFWVPGTATQAVFGPNSQLLQVTFVGVLGGLTYTGVSIFDNKEMAADACQMWFKRQYTLKLCGDVNAGLNFYKVLNIVMTGDTRTLRFFMQTP